MDKKLEQYIRELYRGRPKTLAAELSGITEQEVAEARAEVEGFLDKEKEAIAHTRTITIDALYASALEGDREAAREYLRRTREPDANLLDIAKRCLP